VYGYLLLERIVFMSDKNCIVKIAIWQKKFHKCVWHIVTY